MDLILKREPPTLNFVMGALFIGGSKFCDTLEDPPREAKVPTKTGIPYGRYQVTVTWSNRFQKRMPLVMNVPEFEGVRIHGGRDENDTEGCVLVGYRASIGLLKGGPMVSENLCKMIEQAEQSGKVFLTIE